jgi:ERCC4-type nuclease
MFYLRIDKREQKIIDWLNEKKIPFELEVLDIGDIIIARRGADVNTISGLEDIYIIERKTRRI